MLEFFVGCALLGGFTSFLMALWYLITGLIDYARRP